jgi:hypothetical protein
MKFCFLFPLTKVYCVLTMPGTVLSLGDPETQYGCSLQKGSLVQVQLL